MVKLRALCTVVVLFCASAGVVRAEPIDLSATASINFLDGYHIESTAQDRALGALPLVALDARERRVAIHLETLPPVTFGYSPNASGTKSTRLSLLTSTVRYTIAPGTFAGVGVTIYNQNTDRGTLSSPFESRSEDEYSRVAGARFELGNVRRLAARTTLATIFAVNPVMNGLDQDVETTHLTPPGFPPSTYTCAFANVYGSLACISTRARIAHGLPERAGQIDTSATLVRRLRHGDVIVGFRYLNYVARYELAGNATNLSLADRNVGFMPLIAYRLRARR